MTGIAIIGATSGPGAALLKRLCGEGRSVIGIGRDVQKMELLSGACARAGAHMPEWVTVDVKDHQRLKGALQSADIVFHCSDPRFVPQVLAALGDETQHFIALGSTRLFTKYPDRRMDDVREAEEAALAAPVPATILHPAMIYGDGSETNVLRIIKYLRMTPVLPLPRGGHSLIQPIHVDDVVASLVAASKRPEARNKSIVIAGPEPVSYANFIRACGRAIGKSVMIIPIPLAVAIGLAALARAVPGLPGVTKSEVERLLEDKNFDVIPMSRILGVSPIGLDDGLQRLLSNMDKTA